MKKPVAAIVLTGLIAHAYAQTPPAPPSGQQTAPASGEASSDARTDIGVIPGARAAGAAEGQLTPVYVGASVVGAAVIVGALTGGGSHDGTGGTSGTSGTTGTH